MHEYLIWNKDGGDFEMGEYDIIWGYNFIDALKRSNLLEEYQDGRIKFIREDYID